MLLKWHHLLCLAFLLLTILNSSIADLPPGLSSKSGSYRGLQVRENCFLLYYHCSSVCFVYLMAKDDVLWTFGAYTTLSLGFSKEEKSVRAHRNREMLYVQMWLLSSREKSFIANWKCQECVTNQGCSSVVELPWINPQYQKKSMEPGMLKSHNVCDPQLPFWKMEMVIGLHPWIAIRANWLIHRKVSTTVPDIYVKMMK